MSSVSGRNSPVDRVHDIIKSIERVHVEEISSTQARYTTYVNIIKDKEDQLPRISYQDNTTCCSLSKICSSISCCFQSRCCGRETINFYVSEVHGDQIMLRSKASSTLPSQEQNQLTNASFFIDLYREHGDFLPFMISSAIEYLPTEELKEYWRNWDLESKELLDRKKAEDFKRLLFQTHQVYDEVRMELMKKEMRERLVSLPPKDQVRRHLSIKPQRAASASLADDQLRVASTESKLINIGGRLKEFTKDKVIQDLMLITTCTQAQALKAAQEVENFLSPISTTDEIWEVLLLVVHVHELSIRDTYENLVTEALTHILAEDRPKLVTDISHEKFALLIQAQQRQIASSQEKTKKLTEKEAARQLSRQQPRNFTITV
jgi:hypothetical protein